MKGTSLLHNDEIRRVSNCFDGIFDARNRGLLRTYLRIAKSTCRGCLLGIAEPFSFRLILTNGYGILYATLEPSLSPETFNHIRKKFYMSDLEDTLTHILEHKHQLADVNEATTQQYVVLPILRALGWDDTDLASMAVLPEYQVENRRADYALYVKPIENPTVLIECKRWNEPIARHEEQICFYAYSGDIPLAIITNGRHWRFYLPHWRASSLSDRIFCETDIAVDIDTAISDLERYLLKSNIVSGESELNAEIILEEREKTDIPEPEPSDDRDDSTEIVASRRSPSVSNDFPYSGVALKAMRERAGLTQVEVALALGLAPGSAAGVGDWEAERLKVPPKHQAKLIALYSQTGVVRNWTATRVRHSLSEEVRTYHEAHFSEERRNIFYERVAETQNLIEAEGWRLNPPELTKVLCPFFLSDKGVTRVRRPFGIVLQHFLPYAELIDRNGEKLQMHSLTSNPPRFFAKITEAEARQLERQYGCKFLCISGNHIYYDILDDMKDLLPVLKFRLSQTSRQWTLRLCIRLALLYGKVEFVLLLQNRWKRVRFRCY